MAIAYPCEIVFVLAVPDSAAVIFPRMIALHAFRQGLEGGTFNLLRAWTVTNRGHNHDAIPSQQR